MKLLKVKHCKEFENLKGTSGFRRVKKQCRKFFQKFIKYPLQITYWCMPSMF